LLHEADRCRKCVIAPSTESLRWPDTPSSVRQSPLGRFVGADRLWSKRLASAKRPEGIGRQRVGFALRKPEPRARSKFSPDRSSPCAPETQPVSRTRLEPHARFRQALATCLPRNRSVLNSARAPTALLKRRQRGLGCTIARSGERRKLEFDLNPNDRYRREFLRRAPLP